MEVFEGEDRFYEGLEGLNGEEREKRIREREAERQKEEDEFIFSIEEDLKDPDITFKEKEILGLLLGNLKRKGKPYDALREEILD